MKKMTILHYIKDKKSWIVFYLLMLSLLNFIILLDDGIVVKTSALIYIDILLLLLSFSFFLWRFFVEVAYSKSLLNLLDHQVISSVVQLPEPHFLSEHVMDNVMRDIIQHYQQELSAMKDNTLLESNYTAAWVHEVKAPLTAMKMTIDENRADAGIRKIEAEWLRIHLLIDQQLSIARLSSHETDYLLENISVRRIVSAEVKELASWCLEKSIAVEFVGEEIEAVTDEKWCRFIIRQILTNAVKYSSIGSVITITLQTHASGNSQLIITDTGPGIPKHELPRIFEKGFTGGTGRLHNAATGLGLYLAETVSNKIDVQLSVHSEVGVGTRFTLTFLTKNEYDRTLT